MIRKIVGHQNLNAMNYIANDTLQILHELSKLEEGTQLATVKADKLSNLARGFLFLHSKAMEAGMLETPLNSKKYFETIN